MSKDINDFLRLLALKGGFIVSTARLKTVDINRASLCGRMYIAEGGLGYVWIPDAEVEEYLANKI